jgi:hypothetical protein
MTSFYIVTSYGIKCTLTSLSKSFLVQLTRPFSSDVFHTYLVNIRTTILITSNKRNMKHDFDLVDTVILNENVNLSVCIRRNSVCLMLVSENGLVKAYACPLIKLKCSFISDDMFRLLVIFVFGLFGQHMGRPPGRPQSNST